MDKKFIISTDTCADVYKSFCEKNKIHYIIMKRIVNGCEIGEIFDSEADFDRFYDELKKGSMPTTTQLNPFELKDYFNSILAKEKTGDIIHISLSSGLSTTCMNAISAAEEVNKIMEEKGKNRRVYVIDSLIATLGMGSMLHKLIELRDAGVETTDAVSQIEHMRDHMQGWVIMTDLMHLARGGRISNVKAAVGTMLKLRPIIHVSKKGKLAIENKVSGSAKAIKYVLSRIEKFGEKFDPDFHKSTVWVVRTSRSDLHEQLLSAVKSAYPNLTIKEGIVGPIIGSHLGCGGVAVLWQGATRLDIN